MTDINLRLDRDLLTGLQNRKKILLEDEKKFLKASGLNEEIEKAAQEKEDYQKELADAKKKRDDAKSRKKIAVSKTCTEIESKVNQVLPFGTAVFAFSDDENENLHLTIGWRVTKVLDDGPITADIQTKTTPYNGISGAQKQIFDAALANVLDADIIVIEAAELDHDNLFKLLEQLDKVDKQIIVNTWVPIKEAPESFTIVEV